jgi:hypothetical protein
MIAFYFFGFCKVNAARMVEADICVIGKTDVNEDVFMMYVYIAYLIPIVLPVFS